MSLADKLTAAYVEQSALNSDVVWKLLYEYGFKHHMEWRKERGIQIAINKPYTQFKDSLGNEVRLWYTRFKNRNPGYKSVKFWLRLKDKRSGFTIPAATTITPIEAMLKEHIDLKNAKAVKAKEDTKYKADRLAETKGWYKFKGRKPVKIEIYPPGNGNGKYEIKPGQEFGLLQAINARARGPFGNRKTRILLWPQASARTLMIDREWIEKNCIKAAKPKLAPVAAKPATTTRTAIKKPVPKK